MKLGSIIQELNDLFIKYYELDKRLRSLEERVNEELARIKDEIDEIKYGRGWGK